MIELDALRYRWPGAAHDCLAIDALHVAAGRTLFLHGPSGGGKSTLLGLLAGVLLPSAGTVSLLGTPWASLSGARRDAFRADHVGYIFQQFNLLPYLSVLDNVLLPCRFSGLRRQRAAAAAGSPQAAAGALLQRVGLSRGAVGARGAAAVGGPAAACGRGARADRPARAGDRRRAHLGAGQRAARQLHGAAAAAVPRCRQHAGLRQPRRAPGRAVRPAACRCRRSTTRRRRRPREGHPGHRAAQRLEPARHAGAGGAVGGAVHLPAAGRGAAAQRRARELLAVGQRHRPDRRRAHRADAAAAVRGVPRRRRHQQRAHRQPGGHCQAPRGGLDGAAVAGRFAPRLSGAGHHAGATSSTSATATSSRWRWRRAGPSAATWPACTKWCSAPRWPTGWATGSATSSRSATAAAACPAPNMPTSPSRVVGILQRTGTPVDRTLHISLQAMEAIHLDWVAGVPLPGNEDLGRTGTRRRPDAQAGDRRAASG